MCAEHVADRSQFITQGWPRMKMADGRETRTSGGEVVNVVDGHFSTMSADANPIRSAWARKFEQLDSPGTKTARGPLKKRRMERAQPNAVTFIIALSTPPNRRQPEKIRS